MKIITFNLITPQRVLYKGEIRQASLPTTNGEITILPGHIPVVASLGHGELRVINNDGQVIPWVVGGGLAEVTFSGVTVLAEVGEQVGELADEDAIIKAHERATEAMQNADRQDSEEFAALVGQWEQELARLRAVRKYRHRQIS